jgi:hypothetical protein
MTEEKKVPVRKTPAKVQPKKEVEKNDDVVEDKVSEAKQPVPAKPPKRKIDNDEDIVIMNNTTGRYKYISRTGYVTEMNDYGDTENIPYRELRTMSSGQKRHIEAAFIVILDEDAVKALGYERLYENVLDFEGVEEVLKDPERLDAMLKKMPTTMRETVGSIATRKFRDGELYDMRVKKVIEDNLKIKIDG